MIQFKGWQGGCLALGMSLVLGWGFPAQAAEGKCYKRNYTFNFLAENDLWGSGSDKHFTHGTRLSFVESKEKAKDTQSCTLEQREKESGGLDFIRNIVDSMRDEKSSKTNQVSFILGQNIFTPEDISNPNLVVNDRPYAGWLYVGIGLIRSQIKKEGFTIFDTLELDLGIIDTESYAEDVQKWVHQNISNSPQPEGWDNQLKNEPGILLNLERKWRMEMTSHIRGFAGGFSTERGSGPGECVYLHLPRDDVPAGSQFTGGLRSSAHPARRAGLRLFLI